jgi:CRISPR-associated protein Cas5 subtype I-B
MIFIDISGEMAQFRNFFYNSSVVSYPFFPRTSVLGFLASVLGKEHDSYYEEFKNSFVGICLKTPITKEVKTVNFLKTDGFAKNFHSQMKMEYIRSSSDERLTYRIFYEGDNEDKILKAIDEGNGYLRYMGTTECLADIDRYAKVEYEELNGGECYYIDSVIPTDIIEDLSFDDEKGFFHYEKNRIVYNFKDGRESLGVVDILTETKRLQILVTLKKELSFEVSDVLTIYGRLIETDNGETVYVF